MTPAERTLTLEDFLQAPEQKPALELVDGEITQKVSPKAHHSMVQSWLVERFNQFGRPGKVALAFTELRATYAGASTVPDISVYRWARIQRDERGRLVDDFTEAPDIAVEIVSPGQGVNALVRRCLWYVAKGVQVSLLIDPFDESILLFRPDQSPVALHDADTVDLGDVIPGFTLDLRELFAALTLDA